MSKPLLPLLWALLLMPGARLLATPTPAEIAAALDDPDGIWSFDGAAVEVVPFDGAVGGFALKLEAPRDSYLVVYRAAVSDRMVGRIRFWVDTTEIEALDINHDPLPIAAANPSQWTLAPYHQSDSYGAFRYALYADHEFPAETRVIYLDGFEAAPGILVEPGSWGSEIDIQPAKAFYGADEFVTLTASPDAEHDRFMYWLNAGSAARGDSLTARASEANSYVAVSGSVVTLGGIEVAVSAASATSEPSPGVLRVESLASRSSFSSIRIRSPGTGFVSFLAAQVETELAHAAYSLGSSLLSETPQRIELWASRGEMDIALAFNGALEIWDLAFDPGAPVEISTVGEGSIVGAPASDRSSVGETIVLTAEPAPGWEFAGWSGDVESELATLELEIEGATSIEARFYEQRELLGFQMGVLGGDDWVLEPGGDAISAPSPAPEGWEGALVWSLEGPGEFSFDYALASGKARLLLDSREVSALGQSSSVRSASVMVPPGPHAVALEVWGISAYAQNVQFLNVDWRPGYAIDISSGAGGSVVGAPAPGARVPDGQVISLEASPEPGFSFSHWTDPSRSTEPELMVTAREPTSFQAIFSKAETEDSWVQSQTGAGFWTYEAGAWTTPSDLEPGQSARLEAALEGPRRIQIKAAGDASGSELVYGWDDQPQGSIYAGTNTVDLPAGARSFFIEYQQPPGDAAGPVSILDFKQLVEVRLTALFGLIETSPALTASVGPSTEPTVWRGYLPTGSELTYEAKPDGPNAFAGWAGDLQGKPASGTLIVDASITAEAVFGATSFTSLDGVTWAIDNPRSTFLTYINAGLGLREPTAVTLAAELTGPAALTVGKRQLSRLDVRIDGELSEPLRADSDSEIFYIPSGIRAVAIAFEAMGNVRVDSRYSVSYGISRISRQAGYPVIKNPTVGGTVATALDGGVLIATATPVPGSEFVSWDPPFAGKPATFSIRLDGPAILGATFRTTGSLGGFQWVYSGRAPVLYNPPDTPGLDPNYTEGYFHFNLHGLQPGDAPSSASTIVQGPGELTAHSGTYGYSAALVAELLVDGRAYSKSEAERGIPIGPGAHTVAWRFSAQEESVANVSFFAGLPRVQTSFQIEASASGASVSRNPDKTEYAFGEIVTLTAPETDEDGAPFAGWWAVKKPDFYWTPPNGIFLSDKNPYTFAVSSKTPIVAAYGKRHSDSADVALLSTREHAWNESSAPPSPNGGTTFESGDGWATLVFSAKKDIYLSFDVKQSGLIHFARSTGEDYYVESNGSLGWTRISLALKQGESISLSGHGPSDMIYIGGIASQAGWGPTLVRRADMPIAIEPEGFSDLPPGSTVTLRPAPASAAAFVGWLHEDGALDASETITVESGSDTPVQAVFPGPTNTPLGIAEADFPARWVSDSPIGTLASSQGNLDIPYSEIRFAVEGPSVLAAKSDGSIKAFIDGSPAPWRSYGEPHHENRYIPIPEGARELALRYTSGEDAAQILWDMSLVPGVAVAPRIVDGGRALVYPDKLAFAPGEMASFVAKSSEGWVFAGWKPPYAGEGARFVRPADAELRPEPIFEPYATELEALGRAWRAYGVAPPMQSLESQQSNHARYLERTTLRGAYDLESWVATIVDSPAIVTVGHYPSLLIDGVPADDDRFASELLGDTKTRIGVPAGSELRIPLSNTDIVDLHDDIAFQEGCLLVARGAGLSLRVTPMLSRYPVGAEVTVEALDQVDPEDIEWLGLPADAEIVGRKATFAIANHLRIDALRWEEIRLHGQLFRHAGARDWERSSAGYPTMKGMANRDADFLAFQLPKGSQLRYHFDLAPGGSAIRARLAIFEDGTEIARHSTGGYPPASGLLMANAADREYVFRLFKSGFSSGSHSSDAIFYSLSAIDVPANSYLSWWIGYDPSALAPDELLMPDADPDGDGLHNYAEYLLGSDPLAPDPHLSIRPSDGFYPLQLLSRLPVEPAADAFETQFSLSPAGPWENADDLLLEIEDAELPPEWRGREIAIEPEANVPLFFRLKYQSQTPSLYDLIDE